MLSCPLFSSSGALIRMIMLAMKKIAVK